MHHDDPKVIQATATRCSALPAASRMFVGAVLAVLIGCSGALNNPAVQVPEWATAHAEQVATSDRGMVVSAEPLATAAGVQILEAGGNAVDAAVATAFALAVVEPSMSGIGGRNNMVIRTPSGVIVGIDGFTEVPSGYERREEDGSIGYPTIGIPGAVAGLARALDQHGTMPLSDVMAPAIELAERGYPLPPREAERMAASAERQSEFGEWARIFLKPDGDTYEAGEHFRQPELAATLRAIAEGGRRAFYRGEIARRIAEDMASNDAHLTYEDLAGYEAIPAILVRGSFRGHELVGTHLPASGMASIQALQTMDRFEPAVPAGSTAWAVVTAEALRYAFRDRGADLGSPEQKARTLTSAEWAERRAAEIHVPGVSAARTEQAGVSPAGGIDTGMLAAQAYSAEPSHTTHLTTMDADGGVVALTASLGSSFGSHVVTPGLGFVYASTLQYTNVLSGTPRPRPMTSQSPLLVLRDGEPVLALGAAGGRRIVSAVVSVTARFVDEGLPLPDALAASRVNPLGSDGIELEQGDGRALSEGVEAELEAFGYQVEHGSIARIHGIARDPATGELTGVADSRGSGSAGAPRR